MKTEPPNDDNNPLTEEERSIKEQQDQLLWEFFKKNDVKATTYIYSTYSGRLLRYGLHQFGDEELVRDSIQEVFVDLISNASRLKDVKAIGPFLRKCLVYKILRKLKRRDREITRSQLERTHDNVSYLFEAAQEVEKEFSERDFQQLRAVFYSLSDRQQRAIILRFFRSLRFKQIAKTMDIGRDYAETLVYRTIKKLQSDIRKLRLD